MADCGAQIDSGPLFKRLSQGVETAAWQIVGLRSGEVDGCVCYRLSFETGEPLVGTMILENMATRGPLSSRSAAAAHARSFSSPTTASQMIW